MQFSEIMHALFDITTMQSLLVRAGIWLVIATVIIISTDSAKPDNASIAIKRNVGTLLLFLVLSGGLFYFLFGMSPVLANN
ncbi:MAG: hypothetical protein A3A82_01650 [Candidatus Pacebacteria bacterium RIFCSPLOWO2_01_FULL_47_12]|nr:MAG: hypothetical protein A3J60_02610 [Candidatus Pacebacteria bacterium RIFCSPHIGHO2_02_FULL_46_9]OGJ39397.1 MAG: hypothetical protein A3A82_01650 [Candidatus Pacebacteria bacterium RIFCSPLOWO2_01_FULL_47_12]